MHTRWGFCTFRAVTGYRTGRTLGHLPDANRPPGFCEEEIQQGEDPQLGIYERLRDIPEQAECLNYLGWLFYGYKRAARRGVKATSLARSNSSQTEVDQFIACRCGRIFGKVCDYRRETEAAIIVLGRRTVWDPLLTGETMF